MTEECAVARSVRSMPSGRRAARRLILIVVVTCVGLAGGLVVAAPVSSTAREWSVATSPPAKGVFDAVSCPSTKSCFAVGGRALSDRGPERTLIEHWNGHNWGVMPSPIPTGAAYVGLSGVSCPSTKSCFAVGGSATIDEVSTILVEHWNGHSWSIMTSPRPRRGGLSDVSCPSPKSCFAVGSSLEHWNGTTWSIMTTPTPGGLGSVSCPSTQSCFAVGQHGTKTFVAHWNGRNWRSMPSPNAVGYSNSLFGVSCPDVHSCFAVGRKLNQQRTTYATLIERWNGTSWTIMNGPDLDIPSDSSAVLFDVRCPNTNMCIAVGGIGTTLIERWTRGSVWAVMPSPTPGYTFLYGLGCRSTLGCFAVGNFSNNGNGLSSTLIEQYG